VGAAGDGRIADQSVRRSMCARFRRWAADGMFTWMQQAQARTDAAPGNRLAGVDTT